jgi:hypothetical protein
MASSALPPLHRLAAPLRVAVLNSPGNDPYAPMFQRFLASGLAEESKPLLTVRHACGGCAGGTHTHTQARAR